MSKQKPKPESHVSLIISRWNDNWSFIKDTVPMKITRKQYNRLLKDCIFLYKKTGNDNIGEFYANQYYGERIDVKKLVRLIRKQRRAERLYKRMAGMK